MVYKYIEFSPITPYSTTRNPQTSPKIKRRKTIDIKLSVIIGVVVGYFTFRARGAFPIVAIGFVLGVHPANDNCQKWHY